jgi:hypothetical protein
MLAGCQGDCVTFSGSYKDYGGEFTYCFDKDSSENLELPVFDETDSKGSRKIFGLTEIKIKKIIDTIDSEKSKGMSTSSMKKPAKIDKKPITRLLELLE